MLFLFLCKIQLPPPPPCRRVTTVQANGNWARRDVFLDFCFQQQRTGIQIFPVNCGTAQVQFTCNSALATLAGGWLFIPFECPGMLSEKVAAKTIRDWVQPHHGQQSGTEEACWAKPPRLMDQNHPLPEISFLAW